jgi:hypothetical protein
MKFCLQLFDKLVVYNDRIISKFIPFKDSYDEDFIDINIYYCSDGYNKQ